MNRDALAAQVHAAVEQTTGVTLRGSFLHDDFHWNHGAACTLSDVDLVGFGPPPERARATEAVRDEILNRTGLTVKVSVHPERNFENLTPEDARFLAIGEYLRNEFHALRSPQTAAFLRAKICLLVCRRDGGERYESVARRLGTTEAKEALAVKLGASTSFSVHQARALLSQGRSAESERLLRLLIDLQSPDRSKYKAELVARSTVSLWLREHIAAGLPG